MRPPNPAARRWVRSTVRPISALSTLHIQLTVRACPGPTQAPYHAQAPVPGKDIKVPPAPQAQAVVPTTPGAGPSVPHMGPTPVYHYVNPATHEHVASLLPPNHPQMVCLQEGRHLRETRYGILGASARSSFALIL